jgi:hypothetical protein
MTWNELSVVAEIIGAVAIIVTLIYVAKEIRQNSHPLAISALRDTTSQWNEWGTMLATSADLADIDSRGNVDYDSFRDAERLRYGAYVQSFFDNVESYRALVVDHEVEKDIHVLEAIVARRIGTPGFTAWWQANTADYDGDFVAWSDRLRGSAGTHH